MSLKFNPKRMAYELALLARVIGAGGFFENNAAVTRLKRLGESLVWQMTDGIAQGMHEFTWSTRESGTAKPLRTSASHSYKGTTKDFKALYAEINFEWKCRIEGPDDIRVVDGVTVVSIVRDQLSPKVYHFDISKGGYVEGSGHPPFHAQFYGCVNDIPRLPTFIVSVVDVIDFVLLDLFQERWRSHLDKPETRGSLRELPKLQRDRALKILTRWCDTIKAPAQRHVLLALQTEMATPLEMC